MRMRIDFGVALSLCLRDYIVHIVERRIWNVE